MRRLREVLSLEDMLWAGWLAVLKPASGGMFLEGGNVSAFLALAAVGFWVATLTIEREAPRRPGTVMLMSLGMCAIMIDAGLKQLGAPIEARQIHTAAVVVLGALAAWQHMATGGRAWVRAPRWLRRGLSWPFMMVLADMFSSMMEALVGPKGWSGEHLFTLGFVFLIAMPVIFVFFVVAPRTTISPEAQVSTGGWTLRYLWAVVMALVGVLVGSVLGTGGS